MIVWAVVVLVVIVAGFSLWLVFSQPKETEQKPVRFVCDECGETHCDCHMEDEAS